MEEQEKEIDRLIWVFDSVLGEYNNVSESLYKTKMELEKWRKDPPPLLRKSKK
jgi:hypothetical protein